MEEKAVVEDIFYYTHNKFGPPVNIEKHQIKFHELNILLEGQMTYYINGERFDIKSGDILYLPAGSMRQRELSNSPNNYVGINFHASEKIFEKHLFQDSINEEIVMLLDYLDKIYKSNSATKPQKFTFILEALILQITDNIMKSDKPNLANEIANYLNQHYHEKITLNDISQETFFSVAYCESEFRSAFGISIIQYLLDLRVSEAKKLLIETSMPCSVIAHMVGFDDANYFSRIFKKKIGFSPLQFRAVAIDLNKSPI